jgi:hypothetical protein
MTNPLDAPGWFTNPDQFQFDSSNAAAETQKLVDYFGNDQHYSTEEAKTVGNLAKQYGIDSATLAGMSGDFAPMSETDVNNYVSTNLPDLGVLDGIPTSTGRPYPVGASNFTPVGYAAPAAPFPKAVAERTTAVTGTVAPNQTAQRQLTGLLDNSSKYIRDARQSGIEQAASRGMVNSSISAGSSEREAIRAAAPIAINDANTYSRQSIENQQSQNNANNINAQLGTDVSKANAGYAQGDVENIRSIDASKSNAQLAANTSTSNAQLSAETQRLNQLANNENQRIIQQMSSDSQLIIEKFRIDANIGINDRAQKTQAFSDMVKTIGEIEGNPDLTTAQKNAAITRQVNYNKQYLVYADSLLAA